MFINSADGEKETEKTIKKLERDFLSLTFYYIFTNGFFN